MGGKLRVICTKTAFTALCSDIRGLPPESRASPQGSRRYPASNFQSRRQPSIANFSCRSRRNLLRPANERASPVSRPLSRWIYHRHIRRKFDFVIGRSRDSDRLPNGEPPLWQRSRISLPGSALRRELVWDRRRVTSKTTSARGEADGIYTRGGFPILISERHVRSSLLTSWCLDARSSMSVE